MRSLVGLALLCLAIVGCGGSEAERTRGAYAFPPAPEAPNGPLDPEVAGAIDTLLPQARVGVFDRGIFAPIADSGDARLAWLVSDLHRFYQSSRLEEDALVDAFEKLTGVDPRDVPQFESGSWRTVTDHLIAWDTPPRRATANARASSTSVSSRSGPRSSTTPTPTSIGAVSPGAAFSSTTASSATRRSASEDASLRWTIHP